MSVNNTILQCPACARIITFSHEETNLLQCTCGAVIERRMGTVSARSFPVIQQSADVIQPGTYGKWKDKTFKVLGRFRVWMQESVYNYWSILFDDNTIAYLAEGYGMYAIYERTTIDPGITVPLLNDMKAGNTRNLDKEETFMLERKHTCHKLEMEGEIYLPEYAATFQIFEFAAESGRHVEVVAFKSDTIYSFNVFYTSFGSLQLTNTRIHETGKKLFSCTKCSKPQDVKSLPYVQSYACIYCGSRYILEEGGGLTLHNGKNKNDNGTAITLGAHGLIKGTNYEVIGYVLKEETKAGRSQWKEYTLYNPEEGFAFLSEFDGNWIFVREKGDAPVIETADVSSFNYQNKLYRIFNKYSYNLINVSGAFPYNIFNDHDKDVREFISPPEVWIQEKSNQEGIMWFLGEHISGKEIISAFKNEVVMPYKVGVGAVEPKAFVSPPKIAVATIFAIFILLLVHLLSLLGFQERVLVNKTYTFKDSVSTLSFVTDKFQLGKWRSNLKFDVDAPVDNSWLGLSASLVNASTGREYNLEKGVEYYHGYSDGESWQEGSRYETGYMNGIPAGTYYLQIGGTRETNNDYSAPVEKVRGFQLTVTYDVPTGRNLFICILLLLIFPVVQYLVTQHYEKSRWSNSSFSPYDTHYEN